MLEAIQRFFRSLVGHHPETTRGLAPERDAASLPQDGADNDTAAAAVEIPEPWVPIAEADAPVMRTRGGLTSMGVEEIEAEDVVIASNQGEAVVPVAFKPGDIARVATPKFLWCLDNGHGSLQAGKRSPKFPNGTQLLEWQFNRDIVRRMIPMLEKAGVQYYNVVPEDHVDDFLTERVARANAKTHPLGLPKVFVSIHGNANGSGADWDPNNASGLETFYLTGSARGKVAARVFQQYLTGAFPKWKNRGIKEASFYVLRKTNHTAVLTENGFYTAREQCAEMMLPETRQKIAEAHVAAILHLERSGLGA